MKQITAIIRPQILTKVLKALHECNHYPGVTVQRCEGDARGRGPEGHYVATPENLFLKERSRLDIYCNDDVCEHLVQVIKSAAYTGRHGDGIVAVSEVSRLLRIHSGEQQDQAL